MQIDSSTKTITLNSTHISSEYQTKKIYEIQYKHVKRNVQRVLRELIYDKRHRVFYQHKSKLVLMIYNK